MTEPVLIACVGNADVAADALGPRVAAHLAPLASRDVRVADLGTSPAQLLDLLPERDALIVVDAVVNAPRFSGPLIDLEWPTARTLRSLEPAHSTHGLSVAEQLELADRLEMLPDEVRIVGWAADLDRADGGVDEVAVAAVADRAMQIATHLGRLEPGLRTSAPSGG